MRDDRNFWNAMMFTNKTHGLLQLLPCQAGLSQRRFIFRRLAHFRVWIRSAKARKIQTPDMKSSVRQFVAPRATIETVSDGQGRRKSSAVNVKDNFRFTWGCAPRRKIAQKQFQTVDRTRNKKML